MYFCKGVLYNSLLLTVYPIQTIGLFITLKERNNKMKKLILSVVMMAALSLNTVNAQTKTQKKCDAKAQCDKTKKECKNDGKCCKAKADANAKCCKEKAAKDACCKEKAGKTCNKACDKSKKECKNADKKNCTKCVKTEKK